MDEEQVKELAEINATYTFDKATRQYGEFTDEYVRHFYNKLAELRGGIADVHTCNCQHNSDSRDNEPCYRCDSKQTNADRIRNISDEKLAIFLDNVFNNFFDGFEFPCDVCTERTNCETCFKEWLQSEAE